MLFDNTQKLSEKGKNMFQKLLVIVVIATLLAGCATPSGVSNQQRLDRWGCQLIQTLDRQADMYSRTDLESFPMFLSFLFFTPTVKE